MICSASLEDILCLRQQGGSLVVVRRREFIMSGKDGALTNLLADFPGARSDRSRSFASRNAKRLATPETSRRLSTSVQ